MLFASHLASHDSSQPGAPAPLPPADATAPAAPTPDSTRPRNNTSSAPRRPPPVRLARWDGRPVKPTPHPDDLDPELLRRIDRLVALDSHLVGVARQRWERLLMREYADAAAGGKAGFDAECAAVREAHELINNRLCCATCLQREGPPQALPMGPTERAAGTPAAAASPGDVAAEQGQQRGQQRGQPRGRQGGSGTAQDQAAACRWYTFDDIQYEERIGDPSPGDLPGLEPPECPAAGALAPTAASRTPTPPLTPPPAAPATSPSPPAGRPTTSEAEAGGSPTARGRSSDRDATPASAAAGAPLEAAAHMAAARPTPAGPMARLGGPRPSLVLPEMREARTALCVAALMALGMAAARAARRRAPRALLAPHG